MTTLQPAVSNRSAVARPMPLAPTVMSAPRESAHHTTLHVSPPSTTSCVPVTYFASSEAR